MTWVDWLYALVFTILGWKFWTGDLVLTRPKRLHAWLLRRRMRRVR